MRFLMKCMLGLTLLLPVVLQADNPSASETAHEAPLNIAYIELHNQIDEVFGAVAERQIARAIEGGANKIIFEIDSPGGLLWVCEDLSMKMARLSEQGVKTVAYIPNQALSGGAILAVGCDEIYMHPNATIGNAIPISMMGNIILRAEEKALSSEMKLLRDLGKMKNRPTALLEAFADINLEVFEVVNKQDGSKWFMTTDEVQRAGDQWEQRSRVSEARAGIALTVDGTRAEELMISHGTVNSLEELRQQLNIPEQTPIHTITRTWVDTVVYILNDPAVTGILFFIAIIAIYLEAMTAHGFFGIVSALAFSIFFWSKVMGGTATGLEIALFMVGAGCLALEIFVIPGFGIFGISGILLIFVSLVMASQTFPGFDWGYNIEKTVTAMTTFGGALVAVTFVAFLLSQFLPQVPFLREIVLAPPSQQDAEADFLQRSSAPSSDDAQLLGMDGTAITILRPAGKARFQGRMIEVVSEGPFIDEGETIRIVEIANNRIVVRKASSPEQANA